MSQRPGVTWQGNEAELFEVAMRVVPAVAKHRATGDMLLTAATYKAYLQEASDLNVSAAASWSILSSAYSVWMQNLFNLYAESIDVPVATAIEDAIASTTAWVAKRG